MGTSRPTAMTHEGGGAMGTSRPTAMTHEGGRGDTSVERGGGARGGGKWGGRFSLSSGRIQKMT